MRKLLPWVLASLSVSGAYAQSVQTFQAAPAASRSAPASGSNAELYFLVEQLRNEVQELRGLVEEHGHAIEQMKQQERERYIDLDRRIVELNSRLQSAATSSAPSSGVGASVSSATTAAVVDAASDQPSNKYRQPEAAEKDAYQKARDLIAQKKYDGAVDALYAFIQKYPEGDLTVNAYYWLGEVYLVMPKYEQAVQAFTIVTSRFGDHRKASDAQFKLGVALHKAGKLDEARKALQRVSAAYPGTNAASLAANYLGNL